MEVNDNQFFPPNDVKRTEDHNRIDDIRPDDGSTPRGMGSTDDLNAIKPWTTSSDEMASSEAITPEGHTTGERMNVSPDTASTGQNAGGDANVHVEGPPA